MPSTDDWWAGVQKNDQLVLCQWAGDRHHRSASCSPPLLLLLILLLLLLVYRPSCANSIRRHCCWLVLLLVYCLRPTRAPQVVQIAGLNRFLFERSSLKQIDEESVCFFEIPLTTSSVIPSGSLRFLGLIGHPLVALDIVLFWSEDSNITV